MRKLKVAVPQARVAQQAARVVLLEQLHLQPVARVVLPARVVLLEPAVLLEVLPQPEVQQQVRPQRQALLLGLFRPRAPQLPVLVL